MVGTSAVPAGREVPRVYRLLQEFFGVVLPELADGRIRIDDGVLELAAHALDLADVDVLRRVAVGVHLHRPARRVGDLDLAERGHEGRAVLDLAADRAHRLVEDPRAGVAVLRVEGRDPVVGLLEGRAEAPIGGRVERGRVVVGAHDAERLVAELGQDVLVGVRAAGDERHAPAQAAGGVLAREEQRPPAQRYNEYRVGVFLDLGEIRRVVLDVQRHPELLDDLAAVVLERLVEPADRLPAEGVVETHGHDLLVAEDLRRVLAERVHVAAGREPGADEPLGPLALREIVGRVDRVHRGNFLRFDIGHQRVGDVRQDHAGDHVDAIVLDELPELDEGGRRVALVVLQDDLDLASGHLPAALLPVELAAAVHILAGGRDRAGQGGYEADLDRSLDAATYC